MRCSILAIAPIAIIGALTLTACLGGQSGTTTDVDEQRLAALETEPLFSGGTSTVGGYPNTSARVTFVRGEVFLGSVPWQTRTSADEEDPWRFSVEMIAAVRDAGWTVTRVECTVDSSGAFAAASLVALKDLGGFTAALEARTEDGGGGSLVGLVPYHGESDNPWQPTTPIEAGASCLEQPEPPTTSTQRGGAHNLERGYLETEG